MGRTRKESGHASRDGSRWPPRGGSVWVTRPGSVWATPSCSASPTRVALYRVAADSQKVACSFCYVFTFKSSVSRPSPVEQARKRSRTGHDPASRAQTLGVSGAPGTTPVKMNDAARKSDPISLDISPANGGMSGNQGGWDEGQAPEGQTRRQRTDARSDRGRPAGALERTAEDGVGVAVTAR